ncbi:MAG: hypothetical protein L6R41_004303 [Letrouitia leprolyta]|nr:MAG: hypothetical protein L6R41_004303 [Letrouitia leprolyta]
MYTHLQSLRALHPALRSEVTNEVLEKLHPWCSGEKRILLPGSTVQGCLACTLGLLYNDTGAMNALAVLGKSVFRRGAGYGQLVEEGWLGWWADGTKGVREVRADRARARRETGLSNAEFTDVGMGVEFREVRWGSKPSWSQSLSNSMVMQQRPQPQTPRGPSVTLGRQQGEQKQEAKLMGPPARPDRVKGQTLWTTREETQVPRSDSTRSSNFQGYQATAAQGAEQQRWSGTTLGSTRNSTRPPPILEKSRLRNQYQQPVPPSPLSPHSQRPKSGNRPTSLHAHQQQPIPSIQRSKPYTYRSPPPSTPISIPRPLQPPQRSNNTNSTSKTPFSPTSSSTPSTETTTSSSWTSAMSSDDDEEESIVGQTILNEDSESEYGDMDEIQQRYLDEHDELMKMVGAPGWSRRKPRVKSYLDTLPTMREDTRVSTRASTRMETQTRRE